MKVSIFFPLFAFVASVSFPTVDGERTFFGLCVCVSVCVIFLV